jgi:hypothetical protein
MAMRSRNQSILACYGLSTWALSCLTTAKEKSICFQARSRVFPQPSDSHMHNSRQTQLQRQCDDHRIERGTIMPRMNYRVAAPPQRVLDSIRATVARGDSPGFVQYGMRLVGEISPPDSFRIRRAPGAFAGFSGTVELRGLVKQQPPDGSSVRANLTRSLFVTVAQAFYVGFFLLWTSLAIAASGDRPQFLVFVPVLAAFAIAVLALFEWPARRERRALRECLEHSLRRAGWVPPAASERRLD